MWAFVTLEVGLTVGDSRCALLEVNGLDDDVVQGSRAFNLRAQLAQDVPWVFLTVSSSSLIVGDNEPPVTSGIQQSSFTVDEGGVIDVCVYALNFGPSEVTVLVYLHIEGDLLVCGAYNVF